MTESAPHTEAAADSQAESEGASTSATPRPPRRRALALVGLTVLLAATAWAGWSDFKARRADDTRAQIVASAKEAVLALTTIDHTTIDRDVQRILDASTGDFRDDFDSRAESFKKAAQMAQSTSVGTVREAGVESVDGDSGTVVVALTVMTSNRGAPEKQPKSWRTRVTVTRTDAGFKVSTVEVFP